MAICEISGKGKMYGHNVSFSQRHTRKVFKPNVTKRTLIINGQKVKCNVSASALRTLKKKGLVTSPKDAAKKA
ncbi:50S ribosomal protein L28 [Candidatus Saccharibacteria bacterium]|nr:50S ribosomal protein L28 [Candidatus Saccharibacteria bacterium]MBQ6149877.1 50S ribosomal protein L28 [Candidatus Saccharibacteria bacterium]